MDDHMGPFQTIPDLVLEQIVSNLNNLSDLHNFRLVNKRCHRITFTKRILEKLVFDLRKVKPEDKEFLHIFLEDTNFGNIGKFITCDRIANNPVSTLVANNFIRYAKNLKNLTCDVSLLNRLSICCPRINQVTLIDTSIIYQCQYYVTNRYEISYGCYFRNISSYLDHFVSLTELTVHGIGRVPVTFFSSLSKHKVLRKLCMSFGCFCLDDDDQTYEEEVFSRDEFPTLFITQEHIPEWRFENIKTEDFNLLLPPTARKVTKLNSPNILWHPVSNNLNKLHVGEQALDDFKQELPRKVQELHMELTMSRFNHIPGFAYITMLPNNTLFEKMENICNYDTVTISGALQPFLLKKILCKEGQSCIRRIHLINQPVDVIHSVRSYNIREKHPFRWYDSDIINIVRFNFQLRELVLENFRDISSNLITLITKLKIDIRSLKLIQCKGFDRHSYYVMKNNKQFVLQGTGSCKLCKL